MSKRVLLVGIEPTLVDFTNMPGLDAAKVDAAVRADTKQLSEAGYEVEQCYIDLGETAEAVVAGLLDRTRFDCVMIGAGLRVLAPHVILLEKMINLIHERAPQAKFCFNTNPADTAEAVRRWV